MDEEVESEIDEEQWEKSQAAIAAGRAHLLDVGNRWSLVVENLK